ncbi:hypothetical protein PF005_g22454 [Phytophthora fragariae]|uniref:Transmembrane protein n=1 Tax=Phytophthora fragariae TaxID=53985 RepID=A0A6A3INX9_9STRA|nr:hypothetical protein PF003_g24867 [Phytophthora fragariae]KAE8926572.1 hypothetical protein PF009_g23240 [Phytophthora fragariae]KAE8983771.1 hypothetical protein PF011_g21042 [Phytophthora fragariae]KAE9081920.1 hypothetical protein PF007_g22478 [Phytophthora fragariae]KAE9082068.1 hypothetical protein PF010_g21742 [Phytophthora fragariae]
MTKPRVQPGGKGLSGKGPRTTSVDSTVVTRESEIVMVHAKTKRNSAKWHVFNILRRLAAVAAAVQYISTSMSATWWALQVLSGASNPTETLRVFPSSLIESYVGGGLIRDSPLVQDVLGGDTSPRDFTLFLESETKTSTENCSQVSLFNENIYNYDFLSNGFAGIVADTKYNISTLDKFELVLLVVDCSFSQLVEGDPSEMRIYNLVRSRDDPTDLHLLTTSLSVQEYKVPNLNKQGPALVGMITVIQDMQAENVDQFYMVATTYPYQRSPDFEMYEFVGVTSDSFLELRSVPRDPLTEPVKNLITARKRGFYNGDSQSNIRTMYSTLDGVDAKSALTRWEWTGEAVTVDAWAWVHCIHFFFGLQTIFSLIVLTLVTYQKIRTGKVWIGDPFPSVSTATIVLRGLLVLASWFLDSFWSINEYAMSRAAILTSAPTVRVHKELVHADIQVIILSLVGFLSAIFRERIDPAIVIFLFEFIHKYRLIFVRSSPAVLNEVVAYSSAQYKIGIAKVTAGLAAMCPFRMWSSFQFPKKDPTFLAASFFPTMYLVVIVAGYAILRKIYHYRYPEQIRPRSSHSTDTSGNEKAAMTLRGIVTNFEIATGAELQTRFGLISDYNNYVYFKGMKFASADGVYCSGYVIVNGKFLVRSQDLVAIVMMKLFHARFKNVYTYEVEGNTVKETARLVHTTTFLWSDLWHLNVTVLL